MGWEDRVPYVLSSMNRLADVLFITSQGVLQGDFSGALGLGEGVCLLILPMGGMRDTTARRGEGNAHYRW